MSTIASLFSPQGPLAAHIDGFVARAPQLAMAEAVAQVIVQQQTLLVEAGTGTGKTFAYLVPALASGQRVVISTGSKNLQEQLFYRDLPTIKTALAFTGEVALLKGRSNYLCLTRWLQLLADSSQQKPALLADLMKIRAWASQTMTGDLADLSDVAENSELFPQITSTNDNCLGRDCPEYNQCYLVQARQKALNAQIVVVNHHLFFADLAVKESGFGELVPTAQTYIFDEAHQLPDIASQYFGQSLSSRSLFDLAKSILLAFHSEAADAVQLGKAAELLELSIADWRLSFGLDNSRGETRRLLAEPRWQQAWQRVNERLEFCYELLKLNLSRGEQLSHCFERLTAVRSRLQSLLNCDQLGHSYWYECQGRYFSLQLTPLSVAERFQRERQAQPAAWIFTSATLTVEGNFQHFSTDLGLQGSEQLILDSPFDYAQQAYLWVPRFLPATNAQGRGQQLAQLLLPFLQVQQGGCFFLCTSYQAMQQVAETLRTHLTRQVFLQGEGSKSELLSAFVADGSAILVATSSFWEGIDVRGRALSCVIIDKLPFASPDEPLLKARVDDCQRRGGDAFKQVQIPKAVIALKQGVGRLIRDQNDRGLLVICDPRLVNRPYGATFLQSLPPMPRTRDLDVLLQQ